jgi:hypothetical protein
MMRHRRNKKPACAGFFVAKAKRCTPFSEVTIENRSSPSKKTTVDDRLDLLA